MKKQKKITITVPPAKHWREQPLDMLIQACGDALGWQESLKISTPFTRQGRYLVTWDGKASNGTYYLLPQEVDAWINKYQLTRCEGTALTPGITFDWPAPVE